MEPSEASPAAEPEPGAMPGPAAAPRPGERLMSLDAYRGLAMLAMASDGLGLPEVARHFKESGLWQGVAYQLDHVAWVGCAAWDLIQPSFTFMVGVSMVFSYSKRAERGESYGRMLAHAIWRSVFLVLLGVFLRSTHRPQTYWTFEDVLSQIGLGYTFLFLLWNRRPTVQLAAAGAILLGYWLAFALYPVPAPGFDYSTVGVGPDWQHLTGFAAHWDKNTNLAAAFDQWFLNLFSREKTFVYNGGGYLTLSFIPSLATMIFGLLAGGLLMSGESKTRKVAWLYGAGILGLALGWALDAAGICPNVKRIWTPTWTIFSTGWACVLLATFHGIIDVLGFRRWAFPLVVVGMNSIAMYVMAHTIAGWIAGSIKIHLGSEVFTKLGGIYAPVIEQATVLSILWLILFWMYRRKIFLRI